MGLLPLPELRLKIQLSLVLCLGHHKTLCRSGMVLARLRLALKKFYEKKIFFRNCVKLKEQPYWLLLGDKFNFFKTSLLAA
jgi:hypothetical protein